MALFSKNSNMLSVAASVTILIRAVLGPLFLVYGVGKLARYLDTVDYLKAGFIDSWLPLWMVTTAGYLIPIVETLIGISLLAGLKYRWGLLGLGALMAALIFGLAIQGNHEVVGRNLVFLVIAIFGLQSAHENPYSLDRTLKLG